MNSEFHFSESTSAQFRADFIQEQRFCLAVVGI
jgi:hypothetical protein